MVNKPLIRPAISGGGTLRGGRLTSHYQRLLNFHHRLVLSRDFNHSNSLSQWLNFKLSGITRLVGKIKFKLLSQGPLAE